MHESSGMFTPTQGKGAAGREVQPVPLRAPGGGGGAATAQTKHCETKSHQQIDSAVSHNQGVIVRESVFMLIF